MIETQQFADYAAVRSQWQGLLEAPLAIYKRDAPDYIQQRLAALAVQTVEPDRILAVDGNFQRFIGAGASMHPGVEANGFIMDDSRLYGALHRTLRAPVSPHVNQTEGFTARAIGAAQRTTDQYFGRTLPKAPQRRLELLFSEPGTNGVSTDGTLPIAKFKGIAACAERAAAANDILHVLGMAPVYETGIMQVENRTPEPHAFLVVSGDGKNLLYDPANPAIILNRRSRAVDTQPAIYEVDSIITEERMIEVGGLLHTLKQRPKGPVVSSSLQVRFVTHEDGNNYKPV
jgi:hypothetical protein